MRQMLSAQPGMAFSSEHKERRGKERREEELKLFNTLDRPPNARARAHTGQSGDVSCPVFRTLSKPWS